MVGVVDEGLEDKRVDEHLAHDGTCLETRSMDPDETMRPDDIPHVQDERQATPPGSRLQVVQETEDLPEDPLQGDVAEMRRLVLELYVRHEKSRQGFTMAEAQAHVVQLFKKYHCLERELYTRFCRKYGEEPDPRFLPFEEDPSMAGSSRSRQRDDSRERGPPPEPPTETREVQNTRPTNEDNEGEAKRQALAAVQGFLTQERFEGINATRRRMMMSCQPLHSAVRRSDPDLVSALLTARANPSIKNSAGQTPVALAAKLHGNSVLKAEQDRLTAIMQLLGHGATATPPTSQR